jgi:hypothetical protein
MDKPSVKLSRERTIYSRKDKGRRNLIMLEEPAGPSDLTWDEIDC